MKKKIFETLVHLGVPVQAKGFVFLEKILYKKLTDPDTEKYNMTQLYLSVVEGNESFSPVERAIRYAILSAWKNGSDESFQEFFGCSKKSCLKKPSNSQFIAMCARRIALDAENSRAG